jgi:predicted nucleotidyltransferase
VKNGGPEYQKIANDGTVLRVRTGSQTHGISTESSDRDEMGVCIEPQAYVIGLKKFEQYMYRDAAERTGRFDAPSEPGDLDLTVYSLRKYTSLILNSNPSMLELLYITDPAAIITRTSCGEHIQSIGREYVVSKEAGPKYLGYMEAQRRAMKSYDGKGRDVTRPHLMEKYGFDTKYAGHMVRLGLQGIELMETGKIQLPMNRWEADTIRAIREGKWSMDAVLRYAESLESDLKSAIDKTSLREHPDKDVVNDWLVRSYQLHWGYHLAGPDNCWEY